MKKTRNLIVKTEKYLLVFGILFSQLSFPLSVFAEEVLINDDTEISSPITDTETPVSIENNETEDENKTTEDENKTTEEDDKDDAPESITFTVELTDEACIIRNTLDTTITLNQLKQELNIVKAEDANGIEIVGDDTILITGNQVTISVDGVEQTYYLVIFGDYNDDGIVNDEDQTILLNYIKEDLDDDTIESMLPLIDLNLDNKFDILDVTYPIFTENTWENTKTATDNLENYLKADNETIYIGEEIEVSYNIEGFNADSLVGIMAKLNYDKELLELVSVKVNGQTEEVDDLSNGNLIYLLDSYHQDGTMITLTFKGLKEGEAVVSLENITASLGGVAANLDYNNAYTNFNIIENAKGGDEDAPAASTTVPTTTVVEQPAEVVAQPQASVVKTTTSTLSSDNYIKSLTIKGYEIDFDKNTFEYSINVKSTVSSLDLSVILNDSNASFSVEGNQNFKTGENVVSIIVTAENGDTRTYTIKVNKAKANKTTTDDEETSKESNTSKTIIIILIVLVIIGLIYVIFKDDEDEQKESKK